MARALEKEKRSMVVYRHWLEQHHLENGTWVGDYRHLLFCEFLEYTSQELHRLNLEGFTIYSLSSMMAVIESGDYDFVLFMEER